MHEDWFGDSYDIVKQSLLRRLRSFGEWSVHPMFTEQASPVFISSLETFLDAKVISRDVLAPNTDRSSYFSSGRKCGNLFLDPDTGMRLKSFRGKRSPEYLFASDLASLMELKRNTLEQSCST